MSSVHVLVAHPRTGAGTGAARATRNQGLVPGIIYGNQQLPEMIAIDPKILIKEYHSSGFFSRLFHVSIDGKEQPVLAKDIQVHPVTDAPLHIDFQRVSTSSTLKLFIPITFINEEKCPGLKKGGALNIVHHSLEVICPAIGIPEKIIVDLAKIDLNQAIHLTALSLPEGVKAAHPERDNTIATIAGASSSTEE